MKRITFLCVCPHDCAEEVEVTVERLGGFDTVLGEVEHYRLVSHPSRCKCGAELHRVEPSQEELKAAWHLPEAEDAAR